MSAHRYWRIYFTACPSGGMALTTVSLYNTVGGSIISSLGSYVSADAVGSGSLANLFDANNSTNWSVSGAAPHWVAFDFGAGNDQVIAAYAMQSVIGSGVDPTAWLFQYSDDGTTWTTDSGVSGVTWARSGVLTYGAVGAFGAAASDLKALDVGFGGKPFDQIGTVSGLDTSYGGHPFYGVAASVPATFACTLQAVSTATPALTTNITLATTLQAADTVVAAAINAILFASSLASQSTVTSALTANTQFASALTDVAAASGALSTNVTMAAALGAVASLPSPNLQTDASIAGTVQGQSTVTAALTTNVKMATAMTDTSVVSTLMNTDIRLAAALASVSTVTDSLTTLNNLSASIAASCTATSALTTNIKLAAALADVVTVTPALRAGAVIAAALASESTLTATLSSVPFLMAATIAGQSAITASLTTNTRMAAALVGTVNVASDLLATRSLQATLSCASSISVPPGANGFNTKKTLKAILLNGNGSTFMVLTANLHTDIPLETHLTNQATVTDNGFRAPAVHRFACTLQSSVSLPPPAVNVSITMRASLADAASLAPSNLHTDIRLMSGLLLANAILSEVHLMYRVAVFKNGKLQQVPIGEEGVYTPAKLHNGFLVEGGPGSYLLHRLGKLYEVTDEEVVL
jgi:hypothetical protein